jgi:putative drug exporter of the RND superfamily
VPVRCADDRIKADEKVGFASDRMRQLEGELREAGHLLVRVLVGGAPAFDYQSNQILGEDLIKADLVALPLSLVFLVFVFRGLLAAWLPVLTATVASASTMVALLGFSMVMQVSATAITTVTLLGLGLSIDYGLLLVGRYREEVTARYAPEIAISRACATAGRTIMFSGLTVAACLTGLLALGVTELATVGAAGLSIAMVAMLVSLTFTPALLGAFRRRLTPGRRAARHAGAGVSKLETSFFARLARVVQRFPGSVAAVATAVLLAAGTPLLYTTLRLPGVEGVPDDMESIQVLNELGSRFGIAQEPAITVVARTEASTVDLWARRWTEDPVVSGVQPAKQVKPDLATVQIDVVGDPQSEAAQQLVRRIRADRPPGVSSWVIEDAAALVDIKDRLVRNAPLAVGVTVFAMVVLLFLMTGSLLVPVKAVLASAVSLGATFGVITAVFEHGYLTGPLDLLRTGWLDPFTLVIIFAFAFGLAMDYEVFLLGRVKEHVDQGHDTDTAVRRGLAHTGRIITSAATLMIIVFGAFATSRLGLIQQFGFGLAVAVLVDATVVRCLLVPATMTLLGRWNWWAPAPLQRLHTRLRLRE